MPNERVIVFDAVEGANHTTVDALVEEGLAQPQQFVERRLAPGEGKKKLAFLSFSSGTTGRPKVRYQWMVWRRLGAEHVTCHRWAGGDDPALCGDCELCADEAVCEYKGRAVPE